jgi:starch synthase
VGQQGLGSLPGVLKTGPVAMKFIVAHSGKQHAYRHALALQNRGCLERFVTSTYYRPRCQPDTWFSRWPKADRALRRRHLDGLEASVRRQLLFELPEVACRAVIGNGRLARHLTYLRDVAFDRWVARRQIRACDAQGFWGFQGSCHDSLAAARARGLLAVAEFATGHVVAAERILAAEAERCPEWADSLNNCGFPAWYRRRLEAEPHRADVCVVASSFSRATLEEAGVPAERIRLLPLGADVRRIEFAPRPARGPFRVLFVGSVGQRKGIKYLLDAYERVRSANTRLVVAGPMVGSGRAFEAYRPHAEYLGRVDQARVFAEMARSHVLVLPSLFEGFGLVMVEAMAAGLPVIGSTHSAAPDIIEDGVSGYVVRPDDVDALSDRLMSLARDRDLVGEMGRRAAERAREFGWDRHEDRLADLCREFEASLCHQKAARALAS